MLVVSGERAREPDPVAGADRLPRRERVMNVGNTEAIDEARDLWRRWQNRFAHR
jgi:hypothetical protein